MILFDNIERKFSGPARRMEGYYTFLNRSSLSESEKQRAILEQWFSEYPTKECFELSQRIKNNDPSAFFELFLHALLIRLGCKVLVHPEKEVGNSKRPDFKALPPNGQEFFLEAIVVSEDSYEEQQAQKRINLVLDLLDEMDFPGYMFCIEQTGKPKSQTSATDIKRFIGEKMSQIDRQQIEEGYQTGDPRKLISWKYQHDGWSLTILPIPLANEDEPVERSIGITSYKLGAFPNLKARIRNKVTRYGTFEIPYIIAVNTISGSLHQMEIIDTLFGTLEYRCKRNEAGLSSNYEPVRKSDGVWQNTKNTRVSAVLVANGLRTDNIPRADIQLVHNPWANIKYDSVLNVLPQVIGENGTLKMIDGKPLREIFMLPVEWPEL